MKTAIITDTHIGARNSSKVIREQMMSFFSDFFNKIESEGIKTILHLGDFFDSRTSLSLIDIDFVVNWFIPRLVRSKAHMVVIAGNHDVFYRNTNFINSLSLLKNCPQITVIQDNIHLHKTDGKTFVLCPWLNDENQERLLEDLAHYSTQDYILGLHGEFKGMRMYKNSKLCEHGLDVSLFKGYHHVLSGHFHHPSVHGNIEYMGAANYLNWQDYNDWRGYLIYDDGDDSYERVKNEHCPFIELKYNDKDNVEGKIVRVVVDEEVPHADLKDYIRSLEKMKPISVDVIDNTILESVVDTSDEDDEQPEVGSKSLSSYYSDYLVSIDVGGSDSETLKSKFDDLKARAEEKMKEIE